jgi:diguanylate cyclase (GGDEF)-like protein
MLDREFGAVSRTQKPMSLLMIDVDLFKDLNDAIGHVAGDEYLVRIANELYRKLPRATDFVARYGGKEFAAILPATDEAGAIVIAEKVRQGVADLKLRTCLRSPEQQAEEGQVDHLQACVQFAFAVLP